MKSSSKFKFYRVADAAHCKHRESVDAAAHKCSLSEQRSCLTVRLFVFMV